MNSNSMDTLYNFKRYAFPKFGLFNIDTNQYRYPEGWVQKKSEYKIIGETDDCFVYKLIESGHGEWLGDNVIELKYILPIGIHKTRLVRWKEGQLTIFDFNNGTEFRNKGN